MSRIIILRAGPLVTVQDEGRPGQLIHGVSASGALDRRAYRIAEALTDRACGAALEFSSLGVCFRYEGPECVAGFAGGCFMLSINGKDCGWPGAHVISDGDVVDITTGPWGNFGYMRFDRQMDCPPVLGSRSTNAVVGLGGFKGRALKEGDEISLVLLSSEAAAAHPSPMPVTVDALLEPIRVVWSIHADLFPQEVRAAFIDADFQITGRMDRMGARLRDIAGVFADAQMLSLVSDTVVPGDIQILGDGAPIVLLRDHQPTGGYPRIATIISADLDRFVQIRPSRFVRFQPVTIKTAHAALGGRS